MSDFRELFDQWAPYYDETITDKNGEYKEVFENYKSILFGIAEEVSDYRTILEIGTGTGNLAEVLVNQGLDVTCIEPSKEMRSIATKKHPNLNISDGSFLSIPFVNKKFDAIVSSYAFHHLTLEEKQQAVNYLNQFIKPAGKLIIADSMFETPAYKEGLLKTVRNQNAKRLLYDLETEFYEYLDDMFNLFSQLNYEVTVTKKNKYVWILVATKGGFLDG
ncbi:class I SAM-dependent methyltransferase [Haloplasma contractile]|uniref:Cysteine synthase A protein n=1 Tax=Haloplasma contractile SSD-17B TaxID=1033810 RepID=F7Q1E9_9MOLU|nr:class I SAM-dependent methyltransferase [Haloplasma contractile]ERJ12868.1 cysteine synthase A protein [Haloplasma contractile SSD-17B]